MPTTQRAGQIKVSLYINNATTLLFLFIVEICFTNFKFTLFATNKLHLSLYKHTASGKPLRVQFVRSEHFFLSLRIWMLKIKKRNSQFGNFFFYFTDNISKYFKGAKKCLAFL